MSEIIPDRREVGGDDLLAGLANEKVSAIIAVLLDQLKSVVVGGLGSEGLLHLDDECLTLIALVLVHLHLSLFSITLTSGCLCRSSTSTSSSSSSSSTSASSSSSSSAVILHLCSLWHSTSAVVLSCSAE